MKFTLDWLKDHLETSASVDEISTALTAIGLEVETVEDQGKVLRPFVVAYVAEARDHPNSDHLKVCKVDAGTGTLIDVVCGAPNATTGMKSVFAFPGTWIPGKDFELKAGVVIRGQPSNGMLCSAMELELSDDHEGIIVLPDDAPIGMPYVEYARLGGVVFDISITPNRGDAASSIRRSTASNVEFEYRARANAMPRSTCTAVALSASGTKADGSSAGPLSIGSIICA